MKRFITLAFCMASTLVLLSSCAEKETTYTFVSQSACDFSTEEKTAVDAYVIDLHPYFSQSHSYFGLWEDAWNKAFDEFAAECYKIDNDALIEQLPAGGTYVIYLQDSHSGQITAQSQVWTAPADE